MTYYGFDVEVRCCGLCKGSDWLWVLSVSCGKVINVLLMRLVFIYLLCFRIHNL